MKMRGAEVIEDSDELWRRIRCWVFDQNQGRRRPSSANFANSSDGSGMSVDLGRLRASIYEALEGYPDQGLASFAAGLVRVHGQQVEYRPLEGNRAHCEVIGKKSKQFKSMLAKGSKILRDPGVKE